MTIRLKQTALSVAYQKIISTTHTATSTCRDKEIVFVLCYAPVVAQHLFSSRFQNHYHYLIVLASRWVFHRGFFLFTVNTIKLANLTAVTSFVYFHIAKRILYKKINFMQIIQ